MRLINTATLELHEFFDNQIPEYAILSHRWEDDEVKFQDYHSTIFGPVVMFMGWRLPIPTWRKEGNGALKIRNFCKTVREDYDLKWGWVDTCCIDQKSSAELSEAINSMFKWYARAKVCLVYLSDVKTPSTLQFSSWFTRGWTLQELLAPRNMDFYNHSWRLIGTKQGLRKELHEITKIPEEVLESPMRLFFMCMAQRLSWVGNRITSRAEDIAYCLLGMCEVNMPLLYGEGSDAAFIRLQKEILSKDTDETMFAWWDPYRSESSYRDGLLAPHPEYFAASQTIRDRRKTSSLSTQIPNRKPYQVTNSGLRLDAQIYRVPRIDLFEGYYASKADESIYLIPLNAARCDSKGNPIDVAIFLRLRYHKGYERGDFKSLYTIDDPAELSPVQVKALVEFQNYYQKSGGEITMTGFKEVYIDV